MADRVLSIDFGSSFTKVGLRRGRWVDAELVRHPRLTENLRKLTGNLMAAPRPHP